jgi:ADP-heptose:LPS heptosyltransferase
MTRHALVVRLDSLGDVVICGPAVRAVAAAADRVTVLVGPRGAEAATLLPGVDDVLVWNCPWIVSPPPAVDEADVLDLVARLRARHLDEALVLTSFHQSALPTALLLRLAGIPRVAAISEDYPGDLLTGRIPPPADAPEPERMLAVARAAGYDLPPGDDGLLRLTDGGNAPGAPAAPYVVVHAGTGAAARALPTANWRAVVAALTAAGHRVVLTGSADEAFQAAEIAAAGRPEQVTNLAGRLRLPELAAVLRGAAVCVAANTGPAHVAAAVGTPVVSLFAPVVPAARWAPYGVPVVLLGDQSAPCAGTRAVTCPIAGHPCLTDVPPEAVLAAVEKLVRLPARPAAAREAEEVFA